MRYDERRMIAILDSEDDDGYEIEIEMPAHFEVCGRCDGRGTHDHPAFSNGITADEWNGPDWDDDSREGYLAGRYDVTCSECRGRRVVLEVNYDALNPAQREAYDAYLDGVARDAREQRAERLMGC